MAMSDEEAQNRVLAGQSGGTILSLRLRMSCLFVVCVRVWWVGIVAEYQLLAVSRRKPQRFVAPQLTHFIY